MRMSSPKAIAEYLAEAGVYRVAEGESIPEGFSFKMWNRHAGGEFLRLYFMQQGKLQRIAISIDEEGRVEDVETLRDDERRRGPR